MVNGTLMNITQNNTIVANTTNNTIIDFIGSVDYIYIRNIIADPNIMILMISFAGVYLLLDRFMNKKNHIIYITIVLSFLIWVLVFKIIPFD